MAKLNIESFNKDYQDIAPKECAIFLYECLTENEKKQIKEDWNEAGGYKVIPWWKWCMNNINVSYNK